MSNVVKSPVTIQFRRMLIPKETAQLGVEWDMNSERVEFILPRRYLGEDLSIRQWFVDATDAKGSLLEVKELETAVTEDVIKLLWIVGLLPLAKRGRIMVSLRAIGPDFEWKTEPGEFFLARAPLSGEAPDPPGPSYFNTVLVQMSGLRDQAADSADSAANSEAYARQEADRAQDAANAAVGARDAINGLQVSAYAAAGDEPTATITSTDNSLHIDFRLVRGPQGADGADGGRFTVQGVFPTLAALQAAYPTGNPGDAFAVGTAAQNSIYLWSAHSNAWADVGPLQGPEGIQGQPGITEFTLTDAAAANALPATGTSAANGVMQTVRNCLKWLMALTASIIPTATPNQSVQQALDGLAANVHDVAVNGGISVYTHVKGGNVHYFVGSGPNGRAKMTAAYQWGDVFSIDGAIRPASIGAGATGMAPVGEWVTFTYDGAMIHFNRGVSGGVLPLSNGGTGATDAIGAKWSMCAWPKLLWSGSAGAGDTIYVPELHNYQTYRIAFAQYASIPFLVVRAEGYSYMGGIGGFAPVGDTRFIGLGFFGSIDGASIKIERIGRLDHLASGSHSIFDPYTLASIIGIV